MKKKIKRPIQINLLDLQDKRYVYLAGKINVGSTSSNYRKKVGLVFKKNGLTPLDPLRGKYNTALWDSYSPTGVVMRDMQDLKRAHVVFAVIAQDDGYLSFGTPCEIALASILYHTPVILVTDMPKLAKHFWVKYFCSRVFFAKKGFLQQTINDAVKHTIHWYGQKIELEIFNNPKSV